MSDWKLSRHRGVTVRLVGGLGNQLFGYFAGACLASHLRVPLTLDVRYTRHGATDHGISILQFDLPGIWRLPKVGRGAEERGSDTKKALHLNPLHRKAVSALRILQGRMRQVQDGKHLFRSKYVGYEPALLTLSPGAIVEGYFQSWKHVQCAVFSGYPLRPNLRRRAPWLDDMWALAHVDKPLAIHVRRGDYARTPGFNLLGPAYYEPAIEMMRDLGVAGPIWLFTDGGENARLALGRFGGQARLVSQDRNAANEMLAMSRARAVIMANSTFSWWGAWMAGRDIPVIAPSPWFVSGPPVADLLPPWWMTLSVT